MSYLSDHWRQLLKVSERGGGFVFSERGGVSPPALRA